MGARPNAEATACEELGPVIFRDSFQVLGARLDWLLAPSACRAS